MKLGKNEYWFIILFLSFFGVISFLGSKESLLESLFALIGKIVVAAGMALIAIQTITRRL